MCITFNPIIFADINLSCPTVFFARKGTHSNTHFTVHVLPKYSIEIDVIPGHQAPSGHTSRHLFFLINCLIVLLPANNMSPDGSCRANVSCACARLMLHMDEASSAYQCRCDTIFSPLYILTPGWKYRTISSSPLRCFHPLQIKAIYDRHIIYNCCCAFSPYV